MTQMVVVAVQDKSPRSRYHSRAAKWRMVQVAMVDVDGKAIELAEKDMFVCSLCGNPHALLVTILSHRHWTKQPPLIIY